MNPRSLKAFSHTGRRVFTCWTIDELARRTGIDADVLTVNLRVLSHKQLARGQKGHDRHKASDEEVDPTTWELTALGKAQAAQIIHAEAMMRSV